MINKVAITPANLTDVKGLSLVLQRQGAVYADKGYCTKPVRIAAAQKNTHLCAVKKNNMKGEDFD